MTRAYVTLVMKGNEYVIGALVLARSLRLTGTKHVIACMITRDVSPVAQADLREAFDAVYVVEYYKVRSILLKTAPLRKMYGHWMNESLTWYQSLRLDRFEKVLLVDCDTTILRNMDSLFELPTPAGSFQSCWHLPFYGPLKHGMKV